MAAPQLDVGVEVVEGVPGSGKTLFVVKRLAEVILNQSRPVYTNLPLNWRVFRWWLRGRGGPAKANLVHELKEGHFRAFCDRAALRAKVHEDAHRLRGGYSYEVAERRFVTENGPDRIREVHSWEAEDAHRLNVAALRSAACCAAAVARVAVPVPGPANWIPDAALIVIDEAHKWFPMKDQAREQRSLLNYLSMHRHNMHWLWFVTQRASNLSNSVRKLAAIYVKCRDASLDPIVWGFKLRYLGLRVHRYVAFTAEQVDAESYNNEKPLFVRTVFTQWPSEQKWFRLYRSFSQLASEAEIERSLRRSRLQSGLTENGNDLEDEKETVMRGFSVGPRAAGWLATLAAVVAVGISVFFGVRMFTPEAKAAAVEQSADRKPHSAAAAGPSVGSAGGGGNVLSWPTFEGVGDGWAVFGGRRVAYGDECKGWRLLGASVERRAAVIYRDGDVWVWHIGAEPKRLGSPHLVARALGLKQLDVTGNGGGDAGAAVAGGGVVGPQAGVGGVPDNNRQGDR